MAIEAARAARQSTARAPARLLVAYAVYLVSPASPTDAEDRQALSQQSLPCMVLENLCFPDVAAERIHALVARLIGHLED
jgi:hypothetical protein